MLQTRTDVFTSGPRAKEFNDADNKTREAILAALFSEDATVRLAFRQDAQFGKFWSELAAKFDRALRTFREVPDKQAPGDYIQVLDKKGARGNSFDFLAKTNWSDDSSGLKLEFKRGSSIYDQPQFLQVYAKPGEIIGPEIESYADFLYQEFGQELSYIAGKPLPSRSTYITKVYGTNYETDIFFVSLYNKCKSDSRDLLLQLQYTSIDAYLSRLRREPDFWSKASFQARLDDQLSKYFVSWDTSTQDFVIEQFHRQSITLSGATAFHGGKNGLNKIAFANEAGGSVDALLRWKNNPCVLGPAWQVSLKA